ncbi:MAG: hypothetical protein H6743_03770 [Rickettsiaceae bacterium]|nr:hypothetical protein [Rickettsiaceae bacterium]
MSRDFKLIKTLGGLATDQLPDKISYNKATIVDDMDLSSLGFIQTAGGSIIFGNKTTEQGSCTRLYRFKKNFGTLLNVKLGVFDNGTNAVIKWYNPEADYWNVLADSLTTGTLFDFAPANGNDNNKANLLVWGNKVDNFSTWNGATASVASTTASTIVCNETLRPDNGFDASGTLIAPDGTEYAYTGITDETFTGVTPDPTGLAENDGLAQKPDTTTHSSNVKGNILVIHQAKLFLAGVDTNESKIHYTVTNDVTDFTISSGLASGGTVDVMDHGGAINNLESKGKNTIIVYKDDAVLAYTRDNDGTNVIENWDTILEEEGGGCVNVKSTTKIKDSTYYIAKNKTIKNLEKALNDSSLNVNNIIDEINPTLKNYNVDNASITYFQPKRLMLVAVKSSNDVATNDKVIAIYFRTNEQGGVSADVSIHNVFANDFLVDGDRIFYASALDQNVYELFTNHSRNGIGILHKYATREESYGNPVNKTQPNTLYVEGFFKENTKFKISYLIGLFGLEGEKSWTISKDSNTNGLIRRALSGLGVEELGLLSLGDSLEDSEHLIYFSFPIALMAKESESTRHKVMIETVYDNETDVEAYWGITNIGLNPELRDITTNNILKV